MNFGTLIRHQVDVLALAHDEGFDEREKDFMDQNIHYLMTNESPKVQFEATSTEEEIQDCFDREVILQPQSSASFGKKQEMTLSANFSLTEAEVMSEKETARQSSKNEFSNALVHGVL